MNKNGNQDLMQFGVLLWFVQLLDSWVLTQVFAGLFLGVSFSDGSTC